MANGTLDALQQIIGAAGLGGDQPAGGGQFDAAINKLDFLIREARTPFAFSKDPFGAQKKVTALMQERDRLVEARDSAVSESFSPQQNAPPGFGAAPQTTSALGEFLGGLDPQQLATQQRVQQIDTEIARIERNTAVPFKTRARKIAKLLGARESVVAGGADAEGRANTIEQLLNRKQAESAKLKEFLRQRDNAALQDKAGRDQIVGNIKQRDEETSALAKRLAEIRKSVDADTKDRASELEARAKAAQQAKAAQNQSQGGVVDTKALTTFAVGEDGTPAPTRGVPNTNVGAQVAAASGQAVPGPAAASQQAPAGGGGGRDVQIGQPPAFTVGADVKTSRGFEEVFPGVRSPVSRTETSLSLRPNVLTPGEALRGRFAQRQLSEQERANRAREGIQRQNADQQQRNADRTIQTELFKLRLDIASKRIDARSEARGFELEAGRLINSTLDSMIREKGTVSTPSSYHLALEVGQTGPVDAIDARTRQTAVNVGAGKTQSRFDAGKGNAGAVWNELGLPAVKNDEFVVFSRKQATVLPKDQVIKQYMIATGFAQFITGDDVAFGKDAREAAQKQFKDWLLVRSWKLRKDGAGFDAIPNSREEFAGATADNEIRILNRILTRFGVAPGDTSDVALARSQALTQYLRNPLASTSAFSVASQPNRSSQFGQLNRLLLGLASQDQQTQESVQLIDELARQLPGAIGPFQPSRGR